MVDQPFERQQAMSFSMNASVLATLYGTDEALPLDMALQAGLLSMTLRGGHIVDLKVAGYEVWHGVTFLYRDPDWGTPEPVFRHIVHEAVQNGFSLQLEGFIPTQPAIDLRLKLHGDSQGTVKIEARAVPRGDILTNRIGLCLMHPMHAMGRAIEIEHVDGRISRSTFPEQVPAWPPFTGVRGIRHEFAPGHWAQVRFLGDDFEFEDQRNNADASFKTYSRSNSMPRPYVLRSGAAIEQSLTLTIEAATLPLQCVPAQDAQVRAVSLKAFSQVARMPQLGLAIAPSDAQASPLMLAALAELSPSLLHLMLTRPEQPVQWAGIAQLLSISGAKLRLDVTEGVTAASLAQLAMTLGDVGIKPESVAVFPGPALSISAARQAFPGCAIGGGTPHFFAQFNRMEDVGPADFLSFTVCPTVHGADDASPMAGLQSLPSLLATARTRYPGRSLRIGPSSLGARSSPLGLQPESDGTRRMALAKRDPRSRGLFGAAWLIGHVAMAARGGAEAVSVMSLCGDAGVLDESIDGRLLRHPTFFVLKQLAHLKLMQDVTVMYDMHVVALASAGNDRADWLVANLTNAPINVFVGDNFSACVMDATAWHAYARGWAVSPWRKLSVDLVDIDGVLQLDAFAIAIVTP